METVYELLKVVTVPPKNPESFDFGWVDAGSQRYYLTDRTNSGLDVLDAADDSFTTIAHGFAGPNGILTVPDQNQLWVGDGADCAVKVASLRDSSIIASVSVGAHHPDIIGYDAKDRIVMAGCNLRDNPPVAAFVSAKDFTLLGKVAYPPGTRALETPIWNPQNDKFYLAVPSTPANPGGEIDVYNPVTMNIEAVIPLINCRPNGIALGPDNNLLVCCGTGAIRDGAKAHTLILNASDGRVLETIYEVGGSDQVWYNPADNRYYLSASGMTADGRNTSPPTPVLGVIDASTNRWLANVPTGPGAHSVAVNPKNGHVFVPIRGQGIAVYAERR